MEFTFMEDVEMDNRYRQNPNRFETTAPTLPNLRLGQKHTSLFSVYIFIDDSHDLIKIAVQ